MRLCRCAEGNKLLSLLYMTSSYLFIGLAGKGLCCSDQRPKRCANERVLTFSSGEGASSSHLRMIKFQTDTMTVATSLAMLVYSTYVPCMVSIASAGSEAVPIHKTASLINSPMAAEIKKMTISSHRAISSLCLKTIDMLSRQLTARETKKEMVPAETLSIWA